MAHLLHDLRIAVRSLLRHPGFTSVAVLTLALGAGASTAIFSVVYGVLIRPLPYPQSERIVALWQTARNSFADSVGGTVSHLNYLDWKRGAKSFESLALYGPSRSIFSGAGDAEVIPSAIVTPDFFRAFGAAPVIGREFTPAEDRPGGPQVIVVGHAFWRERLGSAADVLNRTVDISGRPRQIVGVAPVGFDFPRGARIWMPVRNDDRNCGRGCVYLDGIGRLAPGVTVEAARQEMDAIARRLETEFPRANTNVAIGVRLLRDETIGTARAGLLLLLGAVAMVLLIACANVANLVLVRGSSRQSDVAVRAALGASRSRLVSHLLMESVVLAAAGGLAGIVLGAWGVDALKVLAPASIPRLDEVAFDRVTFAFSLGVMALTTLLFGFGPALQLSRVPLSSALGRRGEVPRQRRRWGRSALLASEVGLSLMLLLGAGLLLRSVAALQQIDPGWKAANITTFMVALPSARYPDAARITQTFELLETRLAAQPGVESVGRISGLPLGRQEDVQTVARPDRPAPAPGQQFPALYRVISPGYFQVLGIPLEAGRGFTSADRAGSQPVMIISRRLADALFPAEDALGRTLTVDRGPIEIVGIAANVRSQALTTLPQPEMYLPHGQAAKPSMTFVVKSRQPPSQVLNDARAIVKAADSQLPLIFPETMQEVLDRGLARPRFYLLLLTLFAVLAMALAAVGVYGVVSYAVTQRTREIGVRMALGARRGEVVRLILMQGLRPASAGLIAGLLAAVWAGRAISSELYGVVPYDPLTFAVVTPLLTGVVLAACAVPALRATRVPPAIALRGE